MTSEYECLFEKQRTKQRILIQLDQTKALMNKNAQTLLKRGAHLDDMTRDSIDLVESSRRIYWSSVPWWKRWLFCCLVE